MSVKEILIGKLKEENRFWSFDLDSIGDVNDDVLIEKTLIYLDIPEIKLLFTLYPKKKIKSVWLNSMVLQGDYMRLLNRFYAWYLFDIKNPDRYLKAMETRHLNAICN